MSALFIILVSLTMTWFSEKMLISTRCIHGVMSNLIKKFWTVSNLYFPKVYFSQSQMWTTYGTLQHLSISTMLSLQSRLNIVFYLHLRVTKWHWFLVVSTVGPSKCQLNNFWSEHSLSSEPSKSCLVCTCMTHIRFLKTWLK